MYKELKEFEPLSPTWDRVKYFEKMDLEPGMKKLLIHLTDPALQEQFSNMYGEFARITGDPEMLKKHQEHLEQRAKVQKKQEALSRKHEREREIQEAIGAKMEEEIRLHEAHKHEGRIPLSAKEIRQSVLRSFNLRR